MQDSNCILDNATTESMPKLHDSTTLYQYCIKCRPELHPLLFLLYQHVILRHVGWAPLSPCSWLHNSADISCRLKSCTSRSGCVTLELKNVGPLCSMTKRHVADMAYGCHATAVHTQLKRGLLNNSEVNCVMWICGYVTQPTPLPTIFKIACISIFLRKPKYKEKIHWSRGRTCKLRKTEEWE